MTQLPNGKYTWPVNPTEDLKEFPVPTMPPIDGKVFVEIMTGLRLRDCEVRFAYVTLG